MEPTSSASATTSDEWLAQLKILLAPAAGPDGRIANVSLDEIAQYVAIGEPSNLPARLAGDAALTECLLARPHYTGSQRSLFEPLYENAAAIAPAAFARWGKLVEAAITDKRTWASALPVPAGARWAEAILFHLMRDWARNWAQCVPVSRRFTAQILEKALAADGHDPATLLVAAMATPLGHHHYTAHRSSSVGALIDFGDALQRYAEQVRPHLLPSDVAQRVHLLELLSPLKAEYLKPFAAAIAELASASSKQVNSLAQPLAWRVLDEALPTLKDIARTGKPEQRLQALQFLDDIGRRRNDDALRAFARDTARADKAGSVQELYQQWEARDAAHQHGNANEYTLPVLDWRVAITPAVEDLLAQFWRETDEAIVQYKERFPGSAGNAAPVADQLREPLREYLASAEILPPHFYPIHQTAAGKAGDAMLRAAVHEGASPILLLKIGRFFGVLINPMGWLCYQTTSAIEQHRKRTGRPGMLEYGVALTAMGVETGKLLHAFGHVRERLRPGDRSAEDLWPFYAHYLNHVVHRLKWQVQNSPTADHSSQFRALGLLPQVPPDLVAWLLELALTGPKAQRGPAREVLNRHPQRDQHIIAALGDGKADARAAAAQWVRELALDAAVPALEKAAKAEKQEAVKGAMLETLLALGRSIEPFVDRKALAKEAEKAWSKGAGKDLEWFQWDALPAVNWADTAQPVDPALIRGMVVQAVKQKTPEPHALLRQYCALFDARGREALGQHLLEAWIEEDTRPISVESARRGARDSALHTFRFMKQYPQYYTDSPLKEYTEEQLYELALPKYLKQPVGTAIASKGILALAAACAGERAVATVARYLKDYYGTRAAHCKALVAMLAWIPHPAAVQQLLAVGNRFRTKGIQEEAARQVELMAERKGWTVAELADRTIPAAGFDETGTLTLSYGDREFIARLQPDFTITLQDATGKKLSALPDPRKDDDEAIAKESKKAFTDAKKAIKTILAQQTDRLYEALCTQREWRYEDWDQYLLQHPIARYLVRRLVWAVVEKGESKATFRPLEDGTLTDADDNAVTIARDALIRIAHEFTLPADVAQQWQQHLGDYKIVPLFTLFGRGVYRLPPEQAGQQELKEFEGYTMPNFTLRSRMQKLGYSRTNQGESWFSSYQKVFRPLRITALIEFSGSQMPEENKTVALIHLTFTRDEGDYHEHLTLGEVPGVLLSECYQDLRQLAADSKGFDAQWAEKCRM
ncbi:DUF4132 domain-containing protein [Tahibacter amnicola]|uniref:DUF4132 domain-containing protein n=1 Tax=Tahibacter amnicola TaxID=2976241 RepID=A0ABY6BBP1_9GAMM|nr:DUF4132 domain-containing protein [Tahibacter amnicola]UXI66976.1 DUF4132 domain-containing protein [Tahibacter amnicola]